jgi:amidase
VNDLVYKSARKIARLLRSRKLSRVEVVRAFIAQVERVNPKVNAIVTFLPDQALAEAKRMDARAKRDPGSIGPLAGLPIAFKDTFATKGIRTTYGSPIYADNIPGGGRRDGRAREGGGRDHDRQDQHAGVCRRKPDLQRGFRHDT